MLDQEAILKQVQAALEHEVHLNLREHPVAMRFKDDALVMEGEMPDITSKQRAVGVARMISNGNGLVDHLMVTQSEHVGDGVVRDAVCQQILQNIDFRNCTVCLRSKGQLKMLRHAGADASGTLVIGVEDGCVTLSGQVISLSHKRLAGILAWWSRGCRNVVNALRVAPDEQDSDDEMTEALKLVLETDPFVRAAGQIGVTTTEKAVTLDGYVATEREKRRIEQDAWCLYAVNQVVNHIEVRS